MCLFSERRTAGEGTRGYSKCCERDKRIFITGVMQLRCCALRIQPNFCLQESAQRGESVHRQGLYVAMHPDGRVTGSDALSPYSVLQIKSVKPGHVVIKGQTSSLFLCMDDAGKLRGQTAFYEADCSFRELLLADGYTRFLNSQHGIPLSLASRNSPDRHSVPFTRFLPLRNTLTVSEESTKTQRDFNLDSDDLLGMGQNAVVSPQLLMD